MSAERRNGHWFLVGAGARTAFIAWVRIARYIAPPNA
jgi:hypothetical protein